MALFISVWIFCSFATYGLVVYEFKNVHPYFSPNPFAAAISLFGPVALLVNAMLHEGRWGWTIKTYSREERWMIFSQTYPSSVELNLPGFTRADFDRAY